jgi:hypothetical protein
MIVVASPVISVTINEKMSCAWNASFKLVLRRPWAVRVALTVPMCLASQRIPKLTGSFSFFAFHLAFLRLSYICF